MALAGSQQLPVKIRRPSDQVVPRRAGFYGRERGNGNGNREGDGDGDEGGNGGGDEEEDEK